MNKYRQEFIDEVDRQVCHNEIRRDFLQHKIDDRTTEITGQQLAKAKVELDALEQKIEELKKFQTFLA